MGLGVRVERGPWVRTLLNECELLTTDLRSLALEWL
jgi:hypothetical protein